jgi:hypothetical protein
VRGHHASPHLISSALATQAIHCLARQCDAVGFQPHQVYRLSMSNIAMSIRHGPVICRTWTRGLRQAFEVARVSHGLELSLIFRFSKYRCFKFSAVMLVYAKNGCPSLWATITPTAVVSHNASVMEAVRQGDCQALQCLLDARKASIRDTTLTGETLLHVRSLSRPLEIHRALLIDALGRGNESAAGHFGILVEHLPS